MNYCEICSILGLRKDCSDEDIRKYYRRQAVLVHPDKVCLLSVIVAAVAGHRGRAIARVHPVYLMNVEWRQAVADPRPSQTT